jgi:hypothetical protein
MRYTPDSSRFLTVRALLVILAWWSLPPSVAATEEKPWRFEGVERVVVFPDVHGEFDGLVQLLKSTGVVNDELAWSGGKTHLVSLGDLVDRGARSRDVLELLMRLEREAEEDGGRLHVLMGNHEAMNVLGDLRYVSREEYASFAADETREKRDSAFQGYARWLGVPPDQYALARDGFEQLFPPGFFAHREAFSPEGRYGRWLLERPVVVVIDRLALVHGGLPEAVASIGPEEINRRLPDQIRSHLALWDTLSSAGLGFPEMAFSGRFDHIRRLLEADASGETDIVPAPLEKVAERFLASGGMLAVSEQGPLWYRGTARNDETVEAPVLQAALERLGAERVVVGHTPTPDQRVNTRFGGRVVLLDAGMLESVYSGRAAALVVENGSVRARYGADGRDVRLEEIVAQEHRPLTDAEAEEYLLTAEVISMEEIGTGITRPQRVTLEKDGFRLRAAFKTIDEQITKTVRLRKRTEMNFSDRFRYERAAYLLDRTLGLNMVPVTVIREIDGTEGALTLWVEGAVDERKRRTMKSPDSEDVLELRVMKARMNVFDVLIANIDRNQTNMLYTPHDWKLHLIDHSRAFRLGTERPDHLYDIDLEIDREFADRLRAMTEEALPAEMDELLSKPQMKALLKRRDAVLEEANVFDPAR